MATLDIREWLVNPIAICREFSDGPLFLLLCAMYLRVNGHSDRYLQHLVVVVVGGHFGRHLQGCLATSILIGKS